MTATTRNRDCADEDDKMMLAVFELALEEHPALLSVEEVVRLSATDSAAFGDRDAVSRAIRELHRDGLLHQQGGFVFATRAAVRSGELRV